MLVREPLVDQITLPPPDNERLHGNLDRLVASAKQLKDATTPGGKGTARSPARPQVSPSTRGTAQATKADAAADAALQRAAQAERENAELKSALEAARGDVEQQGVRAVRFIISTIITDRDLQMQHRAAALCTAHFIAWSAGVWCGGSLLIKYWPGVQCMSYHCWHV